MKLAVTTSTTKPKQGTSLEGKVYLKVDRVQGGGGCDLADEQDVLTGQFLDVGLTGTGGIVSVDIG